jgi:molybdopterin-guanine dinucleotide biosynthesis protein A
MQGLILAGGKSSRMGQDKALLPVNGVPLLRSIVEQMGRVCAKVGIASGDESRAGLYREALSGLRRVPVQYIYDRYPDCGPLAGLHAGLTELREGYLFVMACDMPYLSESLLKRMALRAEDHTSDSGGNVADVIHVPEQPFHALYHARAAEIVKQQLEKGEYRLMRLLDALHSEPVETESEEELQAFHNLNTPGAYENFIDLARRNNPG